MSEDLGHVLRDIGLARRGAGLSDREIGRACGVSASTIYRVLANEPRFVDLELLSSIAAAVGQDLRLRAFPSGDAIRDAGSARLLERLRKELHPTIRWRSEVPLPTAGDLRAWDAVISGPGWRLAVEAETVLTDVQAVERRLSLKRRDGGVEHVLLLIADTPRNRRAGAAAPAAFSDLSGRPREVLAALRAGRDPGTNTLLFL